MSDIIRLVRIDFDNLENRISIYETEIGIFLPDQAKNLSASGVMSKWLQSQPPVKIYSGWDGEIYPQWRVEKKKGGGRGT